MISIDIKSPRDSLAKVVETACGLYAYRETLDLTRAGTEAYQKNYISYYKVRRDENWLKEYFAYMQKNIGAKITFAEILEHISSVPHRIKDGKGTTIEASFASKMLATLNPSFPIWDSQVAKAVGMRYDASRKMDDYIKIYDELTDKVNEFLRSVDGTECVVEFDRVFPNFTDISPLKKIDLYLWKMGK